ncbi:HAD-IB family phosphatase [Kribbella solani]|uniref:phosphoserine phosphatase n=1 Tax=Kribbella solani TaxID=236067 RepID=A0A841E628_9ACTN|nr:HAD-IB family phosphatase [Kribbella solani]MBB5982748.1 phosphoserine phosphatase SerB [Kribbella solani]
MAGFDNHLHHLEFRGAFRTWDQLLDRLQQISTPRFTADRALRQLIAGDFLSQLNQGGDDWEATGSNPLPAYAETWPGAVAGGAIDPVYELARTANDLDIYNSALGHLPDDEYVARVRAAVLDAAPRRRDGIDGGVGLAGLVRYTTRDVQVGGRGRAVFALDVHPVDDRRGPLGLRRAGDSFSIEVDVKLPTMIQRTSESERARRSIVGVQLPGLRPITPLLRPIADLAADKMAALSCQPGVGDGILAPRFKDIADLYYIARTCPVDGEKLRTAMAENWQWRETDLGGPPRPYRFYGQAPAQDGEVGILWNQGFDQLRDKVRQLQDYPDFGTMVETIGTFLDGAAEPGHGVWDPVRGQWQASVRSEVAAAMDRAALTPANRPEHASAVMIRPDAGEHQPLVPLQRHLFVFDVDKTLSKHDTLHTLAEKAGLLAELEAVHAPDYETSIRAKIAVLAGVDAALVREVADTVELSDGVIELIRDLKDAGHEIAIASGGFDAIVAPLAERLGVQRYAAGQLGIEDGVLTGEVSGLVDGPGKVTAIEGWSRELGIPRERTIAIGDGSNDVDMFKAVGLAAGYQPGTAAAAAAHTILQDMGHLNRVAHLPLPERLQSPATTPVTTTPATAARRNAGSERT